MWPVGCNGRVVIFDFQTDLIHLTQCSLKTRPPSHTPLLDSSTGSTLWGWKNCKMKNRLSIRCLRDCCRSKETHNLSWSCHQNRSQSPSCCYSKYHKMISLVRIWIVFLMLFVHVFDVLSTLAFRVKEVKTHKDACVYTLKMHIYYYSGQLNKLIIHVMADNW